jgi:hypothetical protein
MESQLDKLKKYGKTLDAYTKSASRAYESGNQRLEDLPLAIKSLQEDFYRLFPEAKESKKIKNDS